MAQRIHKPQVATARDGTECDAKGRFGRSR